MRKLLLVTILLFIPQLALAANTAAAPDGETVIKGDLSALRHTASGRVDKIIDEQTILLKDGKIVRLLGVAFAHDRHDTPSEEPLLAKQALEALVPDGTEIMLYQKRNQTSDTKRGRVNRMGHLLAHVVRKTDGQWLNGVLIARGLATVSTDAANPELHTQLYALEESARKDSAGIWAAASAYGLLSPDTASSGDGQFRVVEGTVVRAATSKNNLYLNFGKDWRSDFTAMVNPSLRKQLARSGIDPLNLTGKTIRVRGWIREWNGPYMELETAERLEIVAASGPSTEESTEPSTDTVENTQSQAGTGQHNP